MSARGWNRCAYCGKASRAEALHVVHFTPDTPFTREETVLVCQQCLDERQHFYGRYQQEQKGGEGE